MMTPCSTVTFLISRGRALVAGRRWVVAIERGIAPVTLGLIAASAVVVTRAADHSLVAYAITAATIALTLFTRLHPLLAIFGAGVLGVLGVV
jgi:chromate transporter